MAENLKTLNNKDPDNDRILNILSSLSIDDMTQVEKLSWNWKRVSQEWFKRLHTLKTKEDGQGNSIWFLMGKNVCQMYTRTEMNDIDRAISILHSYGHYIKNYEVNYMAGSTKPSGERGKFLFQCVPILCQNIVNVNFSLYQDFASSIFEVMTTHWKKLEKLDMKWLSQPVGEDILQLLQNNQQLKILSLKFLRNPDCPVNDKFLTYLPTTIEEIEIEGMSIGNENQFEHFISAIKNFKSLRSLKFSYLEYLSDAAVTVIGNIESLTHLILDHVDLCESHETINPIVNLKNLKSLSLKYNHGLNEDNLIKIVESCINLEELLVCKENMLTDKGMTAISELKSLKILAFDAGDVTNESILNLCGSLEVLDCSNSKMNESDTVKLLKKATNLRFIDITDWKYLTKDIIKAAIEIADERENDILCIYERLPDLRDERVNTAYLKYCNSLVSLNLEIFPENIRNYIEVRYKLLSLKFFD